jgi:hypothetical protein
MQSIRIAFAIGALAAVGSAQIIPGVVTTSSLGTFSTYNLANLTNGIGLSSLDIAATHSVNWQDMWIGGTGITTGQLQFDLGAPQPLAVIAVWNYNSSISTQRGVQNMNVSTSLDAITWTPLSSETLPQAPTPLAALPAHLIAGNSVVARYVQFDILSNYGNNYTGLSEVQFLAGTGSTLGTNTTLGQGCIATRASFYELFAASASFDLANSGLSMIPTGGGYIVVPSASGYVPPSSGATTLVLTDNGQASVTLPAPFAYPGGSTTSLFVAANGNVAVASGNTTTATPSVATMLAATRTAWWAWHDYNPALAGSGQVKYEALGNIAYVTWDGVWDAGGTSVSNASTFQFQFDTVSGVVNLVFQSMSALGNARLVGYSPGGANVDPGNLDLSAVLPATFTVGAIDVNPLTLAGATRPVIGTSWDLNVSNVPATGVLGIDIFGLADPVLVDLAFLGAPGCGARATLDVLAVWPVAGSTHAYSLALPSSTSLVSLHVFTQSAVLQPGVNTLLGGMITSNGIDGRIGDL